MTSSQVSGELDAATATNTANEAWHPSTAADDGDRQSTRAHDDPLLTPPKPSSHSRSLSLDSILGGDMFSPIQERDIGLQLSPILRPSTEFTSHGDHWGQQQQSHQEQGETFSLESTRLGEKDSTLEAVGNAAVEAENDNSQPPEDGANGESTRNSSSPSSNDSMLSTSSNREVEIQLAQQQAGASGQAFIQGLRGAAHRRKMNLTRSRDSLAAKEKERREEVERLALAADQLQLDKVDELGDMHSCDSLGEFRARPLPKSNRMSGVSGLPKPIKRPATTPFSPLLGARRKSMPVGWKSQALSQFPSSRVGTDETAAFRAKPLAKIVAHGGGRAGVPKVPKRPTTTPFSPLLGARRPKNAVRTNRLSLSGASGHSGSNDSDSIPLGLEFISSETENSENHRESESDDAIDPKSVAVPAAAPSKVVFQEFNLRSTSRAERRALFDASRKQRWEARQEEDLRSRRQRIRRLERELGELRWEL